MAETFNLWTEIVSKLGYVDNSQNVCSILLKTAIDIIYLNSTLSTDEILTEELKIIDHCLEYILQKRGVDSQEVFINNLRKNLIKKDEVAYIEDFIQIKEEEGVELIMKILKEKYGEDTLLQKVKQIN